MIPPLTKDELIQRIKVMNNKFWLAQVGNFDLSVSEVAEVLTAVFYGTDDSFPKTLNTLADKFEKRREE
jgi:hypothetical protein